MYTVPPSVSCSHVVDVPIVELKNTDVGKKEADRVERNATMRILP